MEVIDAVEIVDSPFAGASAFVFVAEQQTALELPAHATERSGGKHAVTHYQVTKVFGLTASELSCELETGRTHQIRVH